MSKPIATDRYSASLRARVVKIHERKLLIARLDGSAQAADLTKPPNCHGYGRVRHFLREAANWPANPLPIDPALRFLGRPANDQLEAQVFQNAACNWRCWYCFVPYRLLEGREDSGAWLSASDLLDFYLEEPEPMRPSMIDLTGGQPELVPEWVPWMMEELRARQLEGRIYLWSDDNLSSDYFWTMLDERQRELVASFRGYGRVACFKGFDAESFAFNTEAAPELFDRQFELFAALMKTGIDLYAYATFTGPKETMIAENMKRFVDRLQQIHELLPLRTVPLKIALFGVVQARLSRTAYRLAVKPSLAEANQYRAIEAWCRELDDRFTSDQRATSIVDVYG